MSQQDQPMREVAQRAFAEEFNAANHTFRESDDDRAPIYALLPTGAKANRVFIVGTLTETTNVGDDEEYWQGRIVDPTGTFFVYAGQYQPEAATMLRETESPAFVALVGKPRTYETDDGNVNVSLRPEHLLIVDEETRNRWVTETAKRTLERIERFDEEANEYAQLARDQYGDSIEEYRQAVITAVESLDRAAEDTSAPDAAPEAAGTTSDSASIVEDTGSEPGTSTLDGSANTGGDSSAGGDDYTDSTSDVGEFDAGDFDPDT